MPHTHSSNTFHNPKLIFEEDKVVPVAHSCDRGYIEATCVPMLSKLPFRSRKLMQTKQKQNPSLAFRML